MNRREETEEVLRQGGQKKEMERRKASCQQPRFDNRKNEKNEKHKCGWLLGNSPQ
jgi:hypothetical protein